jgi:hypothetical protein
MLGDGTPHGSRRTVPATSIMGGTHSTSDSSFSPDSGSDSSNGADFGGGSSGGGCASGR